MSLESPNIPSPENQEEKSENEKETPETQAQQSRPEEPVHMLGIETKTVEDYQHLIRLKEDSIKDMTEWRKIHNEEPLDKFSEAVNKEKAAIAEYKAKIEELQS